MITEKQLRLRGVFFVHGDGKSKTFAFVGYRKPEYVANEVSNNEAGSSALSILRILEVKYLVTGDRFHFSADLKYPFS